MCVWVFSQTFDFCGLVVYDMCTVMFLNHKCYILRLLFLGFFDRLLTYIVHKNLILNKILVSRVECTVNGLISAPSINNYISSTGLPNIFYRCDNPNNFSKPANPFISTINIIWIYTSAESIGCFHVVISKIYIYYVIFSD